MNNLVTKTQAIEMSEITCRLARACSRKDSSFADLFNLTPTELRCLRMFSQKSTVAIKEMIKELEISAGRVTHILTSLEKKKYISRRVDSEDKRNHLVDLTPQSRKFIIQLTQKHIQLHQTILKNINPKEQKFIATIMLNLIEELESWTKKNREKLKK